MSTETNPTVLTFATQKGGSGKTTLTHLVALALSGNPIKKRVLAVDIDQQKNLTKCHGRIMKAEGSISYDLITCSPEELRNEVKKVYHQYDYILLDLPGTFMAEGVKTAFLITDYVFVPVQPSQLDIDSFKDVRALLEEIKTTKAQKDAFFEYFFFVSRGELNRVNTKNLVDSFQSGNLPTIDAMFPSYEKFKEVVLSGKNIIENPKDKADLAFTNFFNKVYTILNSN